MNRRDFIKNCITSLGALGLGLNVKGKWESVQDSIHKEDNLGGYLAPQRYVNQRRMALDAEKVMVGKSCKIEILADDGITWTDIVNNTDDTLLDLPIQWRSGKMEMSHDSNNVSWTNIYGISPILEHKEQARTEFREFRLVY